MNIERSKVEEIFLQDMAISGIKHEVGLSIEKLSCRHFYKATLSNDIVLLTDMGSMTGDIVVHTYKSTGNLCLRTSVYKRSHDKSNSYSLIETKEIEPNNRSNFMDYLDRIIKESTPDNPSQWNTYT